MLQEEAQTKGFLCYGKRWVLSARTQGVSGFRAKYHYFGKTYFDNGFHYQNINIAICGGFGCGSFLAGDISLALTKPLPPYQGGKGVCRVVLAVGELGPEAF